MRETASRALAVAYSVLAAFLAGGLLAEFLRNPGLISLVGLAVAAAFLIPVKFFYLRFEDLYPALRSWGRENAGEMVLTAFLVSLSFASFSRGLVFPGSDLLNLSFRASAQIFFPLVDDYGPAGPVLIQASRWMLQVTYLYLVSDIATDLVDGLRKAIFTSRPGR